MEGLVMDKANSFGKFVKDKCQFFGLTQAELARRVGCATITIRKIEADAIRPSAQIGELLAVALVAHQTSFDTLP